jgi:hypothetical protein
MPTLLHVTPGEGGPLTISIRDIVMRGRPLCVAFGAAAWLAGVGSVSAQPAPPRAVEPFVRNTTRFEVWRYFEPPPPTAVFTPGDPSTDHVGNRLLAGLRLRRGRVDGTVALQYVQFGGLPPNASGPGALGTGALYYDHSSDTSSEQVYLKAAHVAFRQIAQHLDIQIGRMPYTSAAERPSGVPKIEAVKRQRLDSRLVGEFEWSMYQRAYDGVRVDWISDSVRVTGSAFQPTQGGFEEAAGVSMSDVNVFSAVVTTAPGKPIPKSEWQVFAHHYTDSRAVTARPDNTGRSATAADIGITTIGSHVVGSRRAGAGEVDAMGWVAAQFGDWYEQRHRGLALTAEGGYQWDRAAWAPWVRGGVSWFSGDADAGDTSHDTFFPMLPTVRRYALSTLYSMANLRDVMVQTIVRPHATVTLRLDGHFLALAERADGWYAGSGATQESGRIFGYTLRPSGNATRLMELVEGSVDWRIGPHWSVNGYLGVATRGPVVRRSFADGPATFFYLENIVQF